MKALAAFAILIFVISATLAGQKAKADTVLVAVASNFNKTAKILVAKFEAQTSHKVVISAGSTGKLYTQIRHQAPYDIFLSADSIRPSKLAEEGFAIKESQFTYAIGQLALLSSDKDLRPVNQDTLLKSDSVSKIAIANADIAPYGKAAVQTLQYLKRYKKMHDKIVRAENVMQAYMYIRSRNVPLGFVSKSLVKKHPTTTYWLVPSELHSPIKQDATLLNKGQKNTAAHEFLTFLKGSQAQQIIKEEGYIAALASQEHTH